MKSSYIRTEIEKSQQFMLQRFSYIPKGFRCPHGLRKVRSDLFRILKENNLYDSSLLGFGISKILDVVEIPLNVCPEHTYMAFDSYHHFRFTPISASEKKMLKLWTILLENNTLINIFLDPIDFSTQPRLELLDQMVNKAIQLGFTFIRLDRLSSFAK
jgi:hypothetical protein